MQPFSLHDLRRIFVHDLLDAGARVLNVGTVKLRIAAIDRGNLGGRATMPCSPWR